MKYELYGIRVDPDYTYSGYTGKTIPVKNLVATFSSKEAAEKYVREAEVSSYSYPSARAGGSIVRHNSYKKSSVLHNYAGYEIEKEATPIEVPHNPTP
jgi:hypothetical protein